MFWTRRVKSEGKAVLVTGCDSGFGNRLALKLNEQGFRVYATVLDVDNTGSRQLAEQCKFKDQMLVLAMDVTNDQQIDSCFDAVEKDLANNGRQLWAIVNNAGLLAYGPTNCGTFDDYKKVFDVNLFGPVRVTRKFSPLIIACQGRIVIVASVLGRITLDYYGIYCMSKSALLAYSDALRREMSKFKVKVATIEPGIFKSAMYYAFEPTFEKCWNETNETFKQLYGQQFYEDLMERTKLQLKAMRAEKNLDIVVNCMIDAIVSRSPNRRYIPVNSFILKPMTLLIPLTPQWLIDFILNMVNIHTKPSSMVNKKM